MIPCFSDQHRELITKRLHDALETQSVSLRVAYDLMEEIEALRARIAELEGQHDLSAGQLARTLRSAHVDDDVAQEEPHRPRPFSPVIRELYPPAIIGEVHEAVPACSALEEDEDALAKSRPPMDTRSVKARKDLAVRLYTDGKPLEQILSEAHVASRTLYSELEKRGIAPRGRPLASRLSGNPMEGRKSHGRKFMGRRTNGKDRRHRPLASLGRWERNYRVGDVSAIIASIVRFGFNGALRVWRGKVMEDARKALRPVFAPVPASTSSFTRPEERDNQHLGGCLAAEKRGEQGRLGAGTE
jgi:hypothetical protein